MSLNEPLDFKRQKSKRAASPTSSYLSMRTDWSIDPPTNFKDGETFPLHSRIKRKRETSPVTSYISLESDNLMNVSEGNDSDLRVRAASPTPTYLSLKTDWSIDPPTNFKTEETFPLDPRLLTEQHLRCPVCKWMLKDPVSIPCGHNYCKGCINAFWDKCADYVCPRCGKASETRPVLNTNAALAEVVKNMQQAGFSPALPPQSYAGPEDVACDLCSERRLKSVKSCTTCGVFLCETHVRQHYTVPALQKHTLCDVTGDIKTRLSQQLQTSDNSFNSTAGGQQHHIDKTQDIIKCPEISDAPEATTPVTDEPEPIAGTEPDPAMIPAAVKKETETGIVLEPETETGIVLEPEPKDKSNQETAVATKLQTRLKRSAKTFRPKTKEKKDNVKSLALICSTLQQEVSGLKEKLSKLESKNTKTEKYEDEEDYEYDKEEEDEEEDYEYGDEDDEEEKDEEYEKEDYGDDNEDYSEKDFLAESDDEDSFDDEDGYKDDYDWEEDDWKENENEEDYDDDNNSEEDSNEDYYDDNDY